MFPQTRKRPSCECKIIILHLKTRGILLGRELQSIDKSLYGIINSNSTKERILKLGRIEIESRLFKVMTSRDGNGSIKRCISIIQFFLQGCFEGNRVKWFAKICTSLKHESYHLLCATRVSNTCLRSTVRVSLCHVTMYVFSRSTLQGEFRGKRI
jgi:hypothetical protein